MLAERFVIGLVGVLVIAGVWLVWRLVALLKAVKEPMVTFKITPPLVSEASCQAHLDFMSALHKLMQQRTWPMRLLNDHYRVALEISGHSKKGIVFSIHCPKRSADSLRQFLMAYQPTAVIETTANSFVNDKWRIYTFKLKTHFACPLKSLAAFKRAEPASYLRAVFAKLSTTDELCLQLSCQAKKLRQVDSLRRKLLQGQLPDVGHQSNHGSILAKLGRSLAWFFESLSDPAGSQPGFTTPAATGKQAQELINSVDDKLKQPLFQTNLRLAVKAASKPQTREYLQAVMAALAVFDNPGIQSWHKNLGWLPQFYQRFLFSRRLLKRPSYCSAAELASLWRLPQQITGGLDKSLSKALPATVSARARAGFEVLIGNNDYHGLKTPIGLTADERARHIYIVGGTGTGKTTLLKYQIIQDMKNGQGLAVLDPHGDLAEELLKCVPKSRTKDVIYIDPDNLKQPIGLNLLELPPALSGDELVKEKDFITEATVSVMRKLFSEEEQGGHRVEYILRNAVQTALTVEDCTLFTVYKLLNNRAFRFKVVRQLEDDNLKLFWQNEMSKAGNMQWLKLTIGVTSKIGRFLFSASARKMLEQPRSTVNFEEALAAKKIIICNFSKGKLGEDTSTLFGTTILAKLQLAALRRARQTESERSEYYVYVDEFQNFATNSFAQMLSEARKYKLFLIMAEQSSQQHQRHRLIDVILANAGTVVAFRCGALADVRLLLPLFEPYLSRSELMNLPAFHFYVRITALKAQEPMSGRTVIPKKLDLLR